jgi:hypothetical protein
VLSPQRRDQAILQSSMDEASKRSKVADVLLTDEDHSALTHILDQSDTSIRVRLPRMLKPGFYSIVLATRGHEMRFLDQDVTIKVE